MRRRVRVEGWAAGGLEELNEPSEKKAKGLG